MRAENLKSSTCLQRAKVIIGNTKNMFLVSTEICSHTFSKTVRARAKTTCAAKGVLQSGRGREAAVKGRAAGSAHHSLSLS
jgi:hypothetical protein